MIQPGDRVRITAQLDNLYRFDSRNGTIVADDGDGYFIIDLDEPAERMTDGELCPSVIEHVTSFVVQR